MKKLLIVMILSLVFFSNPMLIKNSKAGLFSSPLEKCMDRVVEGTFNGNEQSSGAKDLVYIDPKTGNLEILKTIF